MMLRLNLKKTRCFFRMEICPRAQTLLALWDMVEEGKQKLVLDAKRAARRARLRYVVEMRGGFFRKRKGKGFVYLDARGKTVSNPGVLERIRTLAIPPAWRDVWICPWPNGHLQACGVDARGRKQYRYHAAWHEVRDHQKYERMIEFAKSLPRIRRRIQRDLRRPGLGREKILAAVVRLLELTRIRVGNDEYARTNQTFGITTLRNQHVTVRGKQIEFDFQGKHSIRHRVLVQSATLAKIVAACQRIRGKELFKYEIGAGEYRDVTAQDVNEYLRSISKNNVTAKDFRTWAGTVAAAEAFRHCPPAASTHAAKRAIGKVVAQVADVLGKTKAVCRKSYIHPAVINAFTDAKLHCEAVIGGGPQSKTYAGLPNREALVLCLLEQVV